MSTIHHPVHYNSLGAVCRRCGHPIECIDVVERMNFVRGSALKYCWRADLKGGVEDLKKAVWYLEREIARREGTG